MEKPVHLHEAEHGEVRLQFGVKLCEDFELLLAVRVDPLDERSEISFVQKARGHVDFEIGMTLFDPLLQFGRIGVLAVPLGSAESCDQISVDFLGRISVRNVHDEHSSALVGDVVPDRAAAPVFPARQMHVVIGSAVGEEIEYVVLPGIAPGYGSCPARRGQRRSSGIKGTVDALVKPREIGKRALSYKRLNNGPVGAVKA